MRPLFYRTYMVLNYIWIAFFLIAFVVALVKLLVLGRLRRLSGHDGLYVLVVEDRV